MVNASPDTVGTVLDQLIAEVSALAADKADQVRQTLDDAGRKATDVVNDAEKLPDEVVQKIKDLVDPPDWWSLLLVILVEISKLDPHLSVGTMRPEGWSRMVTLTYVTDPPDEKTFTLGLAITDRDLKHGIALKASAPMTVDFGSDLRLRVAADAKTDWTWEFGGAVTPPGADGKLDVDLSWRPPLPELDEPAGGFSVGPLHLHATLAKRPPLPLYTVALGLGVAAEPGRPPLPGVSAKLHPGQALGALATFVQITDLEETYSPEVRLAQGQAPQFTLGHTGL
jgi:hypothetical protein